MLRSNTTSRHLTAGLIEEVMPDDNKDITQPRLSLASSRQVPRRGLALEDALGKPGAPLLVFPEIPITHYQRRQDTRPRQEITTRSRIFPESVVIATRLTVSPK